MALIRIIVGARGIRMSGMLRCKSSFVNGRHFSLYRRVKLFLLLYLLRSLEVVLFASLDSLPLPLIISFSSLFIKTIFEDNQGFCDSRF